MDSQDVLSALRGFPRGTNPGGSGFRAQHLLDAIWGFTAPAASDCLQALTVWVNHLLSGKAHPWLSPWIAGAPLTALRKKDSCVRPIAVGDTFRHLVIKICCSVVRSRLPKFFIPYGQVGVGVQGGLEAAIYAVRCCLQLHSADPDLCLLKVDMRNTFNESCHTTFLRRVRTYFSQLFGWTQWCYAFPAELHFGRNQIQSCVGVQQGNPLLFSLVLAELMDQI